MKPTKVKVSAAAAVKAVDVIAAELVDIRARRAHVYGYRDADAAFVPTPGQDADAQLTAARKAALEQHLVGMSFSGGGIRAGTFAIGFLQGLSRLELLRRIDYLSTVSGGGYAGAWLAAWLKREGQVLEVQKQLNTSRVAQAGANRTPLAGVVDEEPEPVFHLREYSSYLTARPGLLTTDTWSVIAIWLRNMTINLMMILPMALIVVLIARIAVFLYGHISPDAIDGFLADPKTASIEGWIFAAGVVALFSGIVMTVRGGLTGRWFRWPLIVLGVIAVIAGGALFPVALGWGDGMAPGDLLASFRAIGGIGAKAAGWILFGIGLSALMAATTLNAMALGEFRTRAGSGSHYREECPERRLSYIISILIVLAAVLVLIPLRLVVWTAGGAFDSGPAPADGGAARGRLLSSINSLIESQPGLLGLPNVLGHMLLLGGLMATGALLMNLFNGSLYTDIRGGGVAGWITRYFQAGFTYFMAAFASGAIAGALLTLLEALARALDEGAMPGVAATVIPPLGLLIAVVAYIVEVGLLGRQITEAEREWWARLSALLLIGAILWAVAMVTIIYIPAVFLGSGAAVRVALTSGWLGATASGLVMARRYQARREGGGGGGGLGLATIAAVLPPVFLVGLLGGVSLLAAFLVNDPPPQFTTEPGELSGAAGYFLGLVGTPFARLGLSLLGAYVLYLVANRFIDVNLFSLHAMYANRLIRCYLGASRRKPRWQARWGGQHDPREGGGAPSLIPSAGANDPQPERDPNPATGFDLTDDIPLYDFRIGPTTIGGRTTGRDYYGPYLLINTTLNLVAGDELAWRDRKGEAFVFTPRHCGSKGVGYADIVETTRDDLTLGRAITISGAAVDPNMKFYQSATLTAFLTIFNARLGYWMENPLYKPWNAGSPMLGERLWVELFGQTDGTDTYIHLSDGGHFENLGAYELIRRRCRYIIMLDSGEDADPSNDNLADLIRLCRIDFGIDIELDTRPFQAKGPDKLTRAHVVIGRVRYDDVDCGQMPGTLVYVKISMTGDEPPDLQKYARKDPRFPHQATDLRQSFDEEQFECYRALGAHIADAVFADAVFADGVDSPTVQAELNGPVADPRAYIRGNQRLFAAVRYQWAQAPPHHDENDVRVSGEWLALMRDLRRDDGLKPLSEAIYPETKAADQRERHTVAQMFQVMEDAWVGLGLKVNANLPLERGWMNVFRRWANTDALRRHWPAFRPEFGPDFVRFCETQLHMAAAIPVLVRVPAGYAGNPAYAFEDASIKTLIEEFAREWPDLATPKPAFFNPIVSTPKRGLSERIAEALALFNNATPPIWLVVEAPSGHETADQAPADEKFPGGLFLIGPSVDVVVNAAGRTAVATPVANRYELLAWIRRPRRSQRLGSWFIESVLRQARAMLGAGAILRVRYPRSGRGANADQALERWKSFFALYDFQPMAPATGAQESVMERTL